MNSAVLGLTINAMSCASYGEAMMTALGVGLGFALALALMSGVWEKISNKHVPKAFRGLPIALIAASILSMAVMAFR